MSSNALAIVLGWLGSQQRPLSKYADLYKTFGFKTVISIQPSVFQTAIPRLQDASLLRMMEQVVAAIGSNLTLPKPKPTVHIMSNAGFLAFGSLLLLTSPHSPHSQKFLDTHKSLIQPFQDLIQRIECIVIDSAPSNATDDIWSKGTLAAALNTSAVGIEQRYPLLLGATKVVAQQYLKVPSIQNRLDQINTAWRTDRLAIPAPELFLYSTADPLIPYQHIEEFMNEQRQLGIHVEGHRWEKSGHCEHLRMFPEEYQQRVRDFMSQYR